MSQTVTSIRRTRPALSVEEVALREAEHDKALEVLTELLEAHHDSTDSAAFRYVRTVCIRTETTDAG